MVGSWYLPNGWLVGWIDGWMGTYVIIALFSQIRMVRRNLDVTSLIASFSLLSASAPSYSQQEVLHTPWTLWGFLRGLMFSWVSLCATCLHIYSVSSDGQHPLSSLLWPRLNIALLLPFSPNTLTYSYTDLHEGSFPKLSRWEKVVSPQHRMGNDW